MLVSEGTVSNLEIQPTLVEQIKKAQQGHPSIEGIKKKMNLGKTSEFVTDSEGTLWYRDRLCVPNIEELKQQILTESHTAPYSIHPGGTKMYKDIQERFWWHGMKRDIATFIACCDSCQRIKAEHQKPAGLLQPPGYRSGNGMKSEWTSLSDYPDHSVGMTPYGSSQTD